MANHSILLLLLLFNCFRVFSQQETSSDELYKQARSAAFEAKDYDKAIDLSRKALKQSPDYTELSVFLGRLYTWSEKIDSARYVFQGLEDKGVRNEDFFLAYGSLEYWENENTRAANIVDKGLQAHENSEPLLLLRAKIAQDNKQYTLAAESLNRLISLNPDNSDARSLLASIQDFTSKNSIGVTYNFVHFDKQFDDNWHAMSLSYKRLTPIGSAIIRANVARRFARSGSQLELEMYPRISNVFYLYAGIGVSTTPGIFPKFRSGLSLYANLPHSFEGEIGYRQLRFDSNIWMYTASVGKYYKNLWFNLRTFLTPDKDLISHSYAGTIRYYNKGANDYIGLMFGTGISPEGNLNNLLDYETFKLKTYKVGADYNFSIKKSNIFSISGIYYNQEFRPGERGNQFDLTLGYIRTF
ncbi:YaiO family outer membrane beta-barrel protein [Sphingobacterium shayense]|uniref:YaiO family outer membrane beta-barrel protein n=1 Tax=Sphingobacterium shayense TaxID=626343 RepID=UPI0015538C6C|nr:YaiO family outer membrane beta-barrel protein [Sphingobacterium shayense]NQD70917.1 YaiO family outer membrane beta-barrel protein [Sphingobacterium shayense]